MATRRKPIVPGPPESSLASVKASDGAPPLREMHAEEFVRRLRRDEAADKRFALFLGAGCYAAEAMCKRAIEADPKHANAFGSYANFLKKIRKDHDPAEAIYRRAIENDLENTNNLANYAGFLLALGRNPEGLALLDRALQADPAGATEVECWFYVYAHGPANRRREALAALRRLLIVEGVRSPGWDLSANVSRAVEEKHPESEWLARLATVVNGEAEPSVLAPWIAWNAARSH
jgi:tetratricopeptide (TPR) repeat protein